MARTRYVQYTESSYIYDTESYDCVEDKLVNVEIAVPKKSDFDFFGDRYTVIKVNGVRRVRTIYRMPEKTFYEKGRMINYERN